MRTILLRPREPTDGRPLRIVASPSVARAAGPGGLLTLDFLEPPIRARVVGVATRFSTLPPDEPFLVAEETRLATALDADAPGTGRPEELWLSTPGAMLSKVESALARPPFAALVRTSRRRTLSALEDDPMARAVEYTLGIATLLSLALAVVGLWVTLLSDLRDERSDFFDLEAQGVTPETLRRHLRIRALGLLGFGLVGGALLGFVLTRLVVLLIQVSAETGAPQPPLIFSPGWIASGLVLGIVALEARAQAALEDVGLGQRLDHRANSLSAGERQRVAIARALASDVGVLLVDEPTARLDEENGRAIGELLAAAARERGRAVVWATHDPLLVELADEVVELDRSQHLDTEQLSAPN